MLVKRKDIEEISDSYGWCAVCGNMTPFWGPEGEHKEGCPVASDSEYLIVKSETSFYKKISSMFIELLSAGSLSEEEFDRYTQIIKDKAFGRHEDPVAELPHNNTRFNRVVSRVVDTAKTSVLKFDECLDHLLF